MIQTMMDRARLGSVPGVAMVWVRRSSDGPEHRGSFWFGAEHDEEIRRLLSAGASVEFVGWVAEERRRVTTRVVSADPNTGLAVFEGPGEPMVAMDRLRDPEAEIISLPEDHNACHLGAELMTISKEKSPNGWLLWGTYPCCGAVLTDGLPVEPKKVVIGEREFEVPMR